jgi:cytochrome c oxidase assembly protein subunit 15
MNLTARLARGTAVATFALIVLGAIVRATGSGLACPDWPLCHGRVLPPLQPQVLFEWGHRVVALIVSLLTAALAARILFLPAQRRVLGRLVGLALLLLATQVLLGALTVWKLLHFSIVTLHLGNALLFFATLLTIAERADRDPAAPPAPAVPGATGGGRLLWTLAAAAVLAQSLLGGLVSTNHAGLACPDFPLCNGAIWPAGQGPLVHLQLAHRFGAYALAAFLVFAWARSRRAADPRVRAGAEAVLGLVLVQVLLGAFNVLLAVPVWMTAAHLATATTIFALAVVTALRAAPGGRAVPAAAS